MIEAHQPETVEMTNECPNCGLALSDLPDELDEEAKGIAFENHVHACRPGLILDGTR